MNLRSGLILSLTLLVGIVIGSYITQINKPRVITEKDCLTQYNYINARLSCDPRLVINKGEYTNFVKDLTTHIEEETTALHAEHVSVYFRDLHNGPTFGINEKEKFVPASLLKLPALITYLSLVEKEDSLLTREIDYKEVKLNSTQTRDSIPQLEKDKSYKIEDLLSRMIIYSDNVSEALLRNYLSNEYPTDNLLVQTMIDLGLVDPKDPIENTLTVKSYASLFRQLYNSSYLSPEMSEKALKFLSESKYKQALVAGIPNNIKIAHKFGERTDLNNKKQLHDCGIIYYPGNPYLLCVMTRGDDFDELASVIKTISEKVYKEVDSRRY